MEHQIRKRLTPGFRLPKGSPERLRLEAEEALLIKRILGVALLGVLLGWAYY